MTNPADHSAGVNTGEPSTGVSNDPERSRRRAARFRRKVPLFLLIVAVLVLLSLVLGNFQEDKRDHATGTADRRKPPASKPAGPVPAKEFPEVTRDSDGRLQWPRPGTGARKAERDRLVDRHIARGGLYHDVIKDARVVAAMRAVPRHEFVPKSRQYSAYDDTPLPIGHGQTISQPYIVALMTELLEVKAGDKVLEIGTGSGYQAAVLNELTPYVYSIEILKPLYEGVVKRFERLGYQTIRARLGDGYDGWEQHAPFDGIIVTCAAGHIPPPLWQQLKPGGRMVIPVGGVYETQRLIVLTKREDGGRKSRSVLPVRFVPMTGKIQKP